MTSSIVAPGSRVLVTGANGFVAIYVVKKLLQGGYTVRGTVRSAAKGEHLRKVFAEYGDKLEIAVVEDIALPGAFDQVLKGIDAIQHTASPATLTANSPDDIIDPAVKGTIGILESAAANENIKSVVITSSIAAICSLAAKGHFDESSWNTTSPELVKDMKPGELSFQDQLETYLASKTIAEKAAWEFYEKHKDTVKWTLSTICPAFVLGPILQEADSPDQIRSSMAMMWSVIWRKLPREQWFASEFNWIHAEDVALAHVRAMERREASGKRFIASNEFSNWDYWLALHRGETPIPPTPGPDSLTMANSSLRKILGVELTGAAETLKEINTDFKRRNWIQ